MYGEVIGDNYDLSVQLISIDCLILCIVSLTAYVEPSSGYRGSPVC